MKYKVGDKVKLKSKEGLDELKRQFRDLHIHPDAYKNAGSEQIILECKEGFYRYDASSMFWHESLFEGLVEEETKRNACKKCVFAVYDNKPHCGLRGFRSDFNVERCEAESDKVPNGYELQKDGYFSWVEKKKEYPKTYKECCEILDVPTVLGFTGMTDGEADLYGAFISLKRCRDAYWKIAGEEMGLGKPWEPDWENQEPKYCIFFSYNSVEFDDYNHRHHFLAFPTPEMRDAFKENFDPDLEICKELL